MRAARAAAATTTRLGAVRHRGRPLHAGPGEFAAHRCARWVTVSRLCVARQVGDEDVPQRGTPRTSHAAHAKLAGSQVTTRLPPQDTPHLELNAADGHASAIDLGDTEPMAVLPAT